MDFTRRELLIRSSKLLFLTATAARALDRTGEQPAPGDTYHMADHWWGMIVDIDKCIGCGTCVRSCSKENNVPDSYFRTWIERYEVSENLQHPTVDSPKGGIDGFPPAARAELKSFFVPKLCNHCENPPCVQVCPVGATFLSPDGVVLVDQSYCLGCRYCVQACPYGARYFHPEQETAEKCTLCYHRITKGLTTACCETCPTGARQLVDLKDPKDPVHDFLRNNKVQVLKPQLATESKVFYNNLDGSVR
ncbi:MAG: 4Fe-4S ferredoxin [Terriglobia bacterium]|nr:MAG: 4Fe-4S ferredoxin [Terriglobia bacterium]